MKFTVLRGFSLGGGKDVFPGDVIDLPALQGELYVRQGRVREMAETDLNKAALLATIALAGTVEELNELVSENETDQEIIAAYQFRSLELEDEPDH